MSDKFMQLFEAVHASEPDMATIKQLLDEGAHSDVITGDEFEQILKKTKQYTCLYSIKNDTTILNPVIIMLYAVIESWLCHHENANSRKVFDDYLDRLEKQNRTDLLPAIVISYEEILRSSNLHPDTTKFIELRRELLPQYLKARWRIAPHKSLIFAEECEDGLRHEWKFRDVLLEPECKAIEEDIKKNFNAYTDNSAEKDVAWQALKNIFKMMLCDNQHKITPMSTYIADVITDFLDPAHPQCDAMRVALERFSQEEKHPLGFPQFIQNRFSNMYLSMDNFIMPACKPSRLHEARVIFAEKVCRESKYAWVNAGHMLQIKGLIIDGRRSMRELEPHEIDLLLSKLGFYGLIGCPELLSIFVKYKMVKGVIAVSMFLERHSENNHSLLPRKQEILTEALTRLLTLLMSDTQFGTKNNEEEIIVLLGSGLFKKTGMELLLWHQLYLRSVDTFDDYQGILLENITPEEQEFISNNSEHPLCEKVLTTNFNLFADLLSESNKLALKEEILSGEIKSRLGFLMDISLKYNLRSGYLLWKIWKNGVIDHHLSIPDYLLFLSNLGLTRDEASVHVKSKYHEVIKKYLWGIFSYASRNAQDLESQGWIPGSLRILIAYGINPDDYNPESFLSHPNKTLVLSYQVLLMAKQLRFPTKVDENILGRIIAFALLCSYEFEPSLTPPNPEMLSYKQAFIKWLIDFDISNSKLNDRSFHSLHFFHHQLDHSSSYFSDALMDAACLVLKKYDHRINSLEGLRHTCKRVMLSNLQDPDLMQCLAKRVKERGPHCLLMNVLMSHKSDFTLKETPEYKMVMSALPNLPPVEKPVNVSIYENTPITASPENLAYLKQQLDGESVSPRDAALYIALNKHLLWQEASQIIYKHLLSVELTAAQREELTQALKVLSESKFTFLKQQVNEFASKAKVVDGSGDDRKLLDIKAKVSEIVKRDDDSAKNNPLMLILKTGKTSYHYRKTKHANALVSYYNDADELSPSDLVIFNLFAKNSTAPMPDENTQKMFDEANNKVFGL